MEERAQLAQDTIDFKETRGIPSWMVHVMDMVFIEDFLGSPRGSFQRDCHRLYAQFQDRCGVCMIDQYLADNPLSMHQEGFGEEAPRGATTGAHQIVRDGIVIDSPETVVEHMERVTFPTLVRQKQELEANLEAKAKELLEGELFLQQKLGPNILKVPYCQSIPYHDYYGYGYENYFTAYALYPEMIEKAFSLQADYSVVYNRAIVQAVQLGHLPRLIRIDHDIADSRGVLVDLQSLEKLYMPHLARALGPLLEAGIRCIWHCDGNLMALVPLLLQAGIGGFQGFQYEDGMDYVSICRMKDRTAHPLLIIAGVSTSKVLPHGTRQDVADQLKWLVENGPRQGLFLGASSSIVPNTNRENIRTLIEGLNYYRTHGR